MLRLQFDRTFGIISDRLNLSSQVSKAIAKISIEQERGQKLRFGKLKKHSNSSRKLLRHLVQPLIYSEPRLIKKVLLRTAFLID